MSSEFVVRVSERELPAPIKACHEFMELNQTQQENFISRLRYIEEIGSKVEHWLSAPSSDGGEFKLFLDNVELDLMVNLGTAGDSKSVVSPWLLHSSWTFETSSTAMRRAVGSEMISSLELPTPRLSCSLTEFAGWLRCVREHLDLALSAFYEAESFDSAMASLLVIDVYLSQMYGTVIAQRLNPRIIETD